jgi:hypothetical protein
MNSIKRDFIDIFLRDQVEYAERIWSSEINPMAVFFQEERFGVHGLQS